MKKRYRRRFLVGEVVRANKRSVLEGMEGSILKTLVNVEEGTDKFVEEIYVKFGNSNNIIIMEPEMLNSTGIVL